MNPIKLDACPQCDLLLRRIDPELGEKAQCPRCAYLLYYPRKHSIERTLALSMAGLIMFFPANFLPLMGIKLLGNSHDGSLISGVIGLFNEGLWAVAVLVFVSSILFPLTNVLLSLLISAHLYLNKPNRFLAQWMRWLQHLDEWAMLEVYALGIIVASVKLASTADLKMGFGLYAFVTLLLITAMLASSLDRYLFWQRIARLRS